MPHSHLPHLRVNYRVFTVFLLVGLVMLAVAGVIVLGAGQARLRASFGDHLGDVADQSAARVDSYVFRRVIDVSILAAVPDVKREAAAASAVPLDPAAVRRYDQQWGAGIPAQLALTQSPAALFLAHASINDQTYRELMLADRQGRLVAASGRTSDYFQGDEEWFVKTLGDGIKGRLHVGGVLWDESADTWALEVCVPVVSPDEKLLAGVLKAVVDVREIGGAVSAIRLGDTGEAALVTDDGNMVLVARQPAAGVQFFAADLLREKMQAVASQEWTGAIHFRARTPSGDVRLVGVGVSQLRASYPHLPWLVVVSQSESELFAPIRFQLWSLLGVLALTAIAVLGLAVWFSLRLSALLPEDELHLVRHAKVEMIDGEEVGN